MTHSSAPTSAKLVLPRDNAVPDGVHPSLLSPAYCSTVGRAPLQQLVNMEGQASP